MEGINLYANYTCIKHYNSCYLFSDEPEYKNIIIIFCSIGALACAYEALRIYRKNRN